MSLFIEEISRIGDTLWYSGGVQFLQGIVIEEGTQTGVGSNKKRGFSLFSN